MPEHPEEQSTLVRIFCRGGPMWPPARGDFFFGRARRPGAPSHRVSPCGASFFPSDGKETKGSPGTAPDEHFVLIVAFPRTPLRGTRTC